MKYGALVFLVGCAANIEPEQVDAVLALTGDAAAGATVYTDHCAECHDEDGAGRKGVVLAEVVPELTDEELVESILAGPSIMPNFVNTLDDQQVADVAAHLRATWP